jgi:predicted Zn finger-like uncharacterized protein
MKFSCESCSAQYMISDEKVGPAGVKVRCKKCGNIMAVKRPPAAAPAPLEPAPTLAAASSGAAPSASGAGETTLENELGTAFQNVFGGGSAAIAAEKATAHPAAPPPDATNPAHNGVGSAEAIHDWYVAIDDTQVGPLAASAVKTRWESAEIGPDTLAWRPGMADWVALSRIPEMAQYLAPVARGGAKAAPAPTPAPRQDAAAAGAPSATPAPGAKEAAKPAHANGANGKASEWKPSGASALAALASEEMASLAKPEARAAPEPVATRGSGSLLDRMDLPDGGVDPTNVLPLPIKGLEQTSEAPIQRAPAPRGGESTEIRQLKKSTRRSLLAIGGGMLLLFALGIAVVVALVRPSREAPAPVAAAPLPAAPAPAPAAAAPAPAPSPEVTPPATAPAAPAPNAAATPPANAQASAAPPPSASAPPPAAAPAPKEPERVAAAPAQHEPPPQREVVSKRTRHREPPPARAAAPERPKRGQRLAQSDPPPQQMARPEPAPQAAPAAPPPPAPRAQGDGDDDIDKILSGSGGSAPAASSAGAPKKRSVYVPPALGSDLPENVSVSQINEAVLGQKPALMRCIEQQKAAEPDTRGTLKLRWVIAGDGGVRDVRVVSDEFSRQPIASCISSIVRGLHFPRSRTTGQEVVFPFKF